MIMELSPQQEKARSEFRAFVDQEVIPRAHENDRQERIGPDLINRLARAGHMGAALPREFSGAGLDMITYGLLHEEVGRGCSSLRSLLTVHGMVAATLLRWGNNNQKEYWLPRLASGEVLAAFGLTEPEIGSDARSIQSTASLDGDYYILSGQKRWITGGQIAGLFLIFAQCEGKHAAFLVERESPGLCLEPISGMYGIRASMLADLRMEECRIPKNNLVGRIGFGFSHVASTALDHGRYCVACGCVGIAQACVEASVSYASQRKQFGVCLKDHQLIQRMIADMITNLKAARLLCRHAGYLRDKGDPASIIETSVAKYFASKAAARAANDAVQIHGANGCSGDYPVERYLRDAKIMEIIEGSNQMQQITISTLGFQEFLPSREDRYWRKQSAS